MCRFNYLYVSNKRDLFVKLSKLGHTNFHVVDKVQWHMKFYRFLIRHIYATK